MGDSYYLNVYTVKVCVQVAVSTEVPHGSLPRHQPAGQEGGGGDQHTAHLQGGQQPLAPRQVVQELRSDRSRRLHQRVQ